MARPQATGKFSTRAKLEQAVLRMFDEAKERPRPVLIAELCGVSLPVVYKILGTREWVPPVPAVVESASTPAAVTPASVPAAVPAKPVPAGNETVEAIKKYGIALVRVSVQPGKRRWWARVPGAEALDKSLEIAVEMLVQTITEGGLG